MLKRLALLPCMAFIILGVPVARAQSSKELPPAWPRPGATLLVENDRGAAYNVVYPQGKPTSFHRHRYFFAGLDLNTATIKVTDTEGKFRLGPVIKNRMWFLPKDLTHQEMSTTDPGRHTVVIDIKEKTAPEVRNTTQYPTNNYAAFQTKVVDNERVVIWDCAWADGAAPTTSFNSRDMFVAIAEGGDLSVVSAGEAPRFEHYNAGQAIFLPGGQARTISSRNGTVHVMLVEVK
jgi:hypothetical protein